MLPWMAAGGPKTGIRVSQRINHGALKGARSQVPQQLERVQLDSRIVYILCMGGVLAWATHFTKDIAMRQEWL